MLLPKTKGHCSKAGAQTRRFGFVGHGRFPTKALRTKTTRPDSTLSRVQDESLTIDQICVR
jgi:hypothetical protein